MPQRRCQGLSKGGHRRDSSRRSFGWAVFDLMVKMATNRDDSSPTANPHRDRSLRAPRAAPRARQPHQRLATGCQTPSASRPQRTSAGRTPGPGPGTGPRARDTVQQAGTARAAGRSGRAVTLGVSAAALGRPCNLQSTRGRATSTQMTLCVSASYRSTGIIRARRGEREREKAPPPPPTPPTPPGPPNRGGPIHPSHPGAVGGPAGPDGSGATAPRAGQPDDSDGPSHHWKCGMVCVGGRAWSRWTSPGSAAATPPRAPQSCTTPCALLINNQSLLIYN